MSLQTSTWQTVGPFFRIGLERLFDTDIAGENIQGTRVAVQGRVLDGGGRPVPDAVIEVWQANAQGKYAHPVDTQDRPLEPGFKGFGRVPTDDDGVFRFATIKPGSVPGPGGRPQAPHLVIGLLMRGLLRGLVTRAYFPNEPTNAADPILQMIEAPRRKTLLLENSPEHDNLLLWDIHMQGDMETVFFDF